MAHTPIPDWQLPAGVDRGLWDYLHSEEMVQSYDAHMAISPLAQADINFCLQQFGTPGKLLDLGCGTGRLCASFAQQGYDCVGVDLSVPMLEVARARPERVTWIHGNLLDLPKLVSHDFDYAACLFSTLGMLSTQADRMQFLKAVAQVVKPGGRFVVHVHNRWYLGLGWRKWITGKMAMPQAYGGAPLTLHHFRHEEIASMLQAAGFRITRSLAVQATQTTPLPAPWLLSRLRAYGYLIACEKPA